MKNLADDKSLSSISKTLSRENSIFPRKVPPEVKVLIKAGLDKSIYRKMIKCKVSFRFFIHFFYKYS